MTGVVPIGAVAKARTRSKPQSRWRMTRTPDRMNSRDEKPCGYSGVFRMAPIGNAKSEPLDGRCVELLTAAVTEHP